MKQVLIFVMCFICAHFVLTGIVSFVMWEVSFFNIAEWNLYGRGLYLWFVLSFGALAGILVNTYIATAHKS